MKMENEKLMTGSTGMKRGADIRGRCPDSRRAGGRHPGNSVEADRIKVNQTKVLAYGHQPLFLFGRGAPAKGQLILKSGKLVAARKHENCETNPNQKHINRLILPGQNGVFGDKKRTQMNPNKANLNPL